MTARCEGVVGSFWEDLNLPGRIWQVQSLAPRLAGPNGARTGGSVTLKLVEAGPGLEPPGIPHPDLTVTLDELSQSFFLCSQFTTNRLRYL